MKDPLQIRDIRFFKATSIISQPIADASLGQIGDMTDELLYANRHWLDRFYDDGDPCKVTSGNDNMFFF
jgi:hypothetical protein